jgi:transposase
VQKSLVGTWRPEHLFTLKQSRQIHQQYQESITACDQEIEKLVVAFEPRVDPAEQPLPPDRKAKQRKRKKKGVTPGVNPKTGFDMRTEAYKLFGVDVTQIPGLMMMALMLFSEIGRDMSKWPRPLAQPHRSTYRG